MGTTFLVANSAKRQYFDPDGMGSKENSKRSGILWGLSGHALGQLLRPDAQLGYYLDTWIGDPLFLVGDEAEPNSIAHLRRFQGSPEQDAWHIVTEQFDNITLNLIAFLCNHPAVMGYFLDDAKESSYTFLSLIHTMTHLSASHIESAVVREFGADWRDRYYAVLNEEPFHYPLPMTPQTRAGQAPKIVRAVDVIRARAPIENG
jgi:hypothetical protein